MEADHEHYLAMVLARQMKSTVAEVLRLGHKRPDPSHQELVYPAQPPPDHLWVTDDLRHWLGRKGCEREGLAMWILRRRRGTVRSPQNQSSSYQTCPFCRCRAGQAPGASCMRRS